MNARNMEPTKERITIIKKSSSCKHIKINLPLLGSRAEELVPWPTETQTALKPF